MCRVQVGADEYMAFGISGNASRSAMLGADVAVVHYSAAQQRGLAADYNVTAIAPVSIPLAVPRTWHTSMKQLLSDNLEMLRGVRVRSATRPPVECTN